MTGNQAMVELRAKGYDILFVLISSDWSGAEEYTRQGAMAFIAKIDMGSEFLNYLQAAPLDPFACVLNRFEHGTTTNSLQLRAAGRSSENTGIRESLVPRIVGRN